MIFLDLIFTHKFDKKKTKHKISNVSEVKTNRRIRKRNMLFVTTLLILRANF